MRPVVFLTGGGGFIGRRLLPLLARQADLVCLIRRPESMAAELRARPGLTVVAGDLLNSDSYSGALARCDTVVHLAGLTGKASARDMDRVNREGTRHLLDTSRRAGVRNFLFVSTIAVKFLDLRRYAYARAKKAAERLVRESDLRFAIARPTAVFGHGSPNWRGLARLARLPVTPIFGDGRNRIQPIWVDDLCQCLDAMVRDDRFHGEVLELGGRDWITINELMQKLRRAYGKLPNRLVHLPIEPIRQALAALEPWALPFLPFTAGQLGAFAEDGTALTNPIQQERLGRMKSIEQMVNELA